MTIADFRTLALAIPGASEGEHMKHPDFRVGGKIFASLGAPDVGWGMVKLTPEQQRGVLAKSPGAFRPCNGAWGRQGCTNVFLADAPRAVVQAALSDAAQNIASAKKTKSAKKPKAPK